MKSLWVSFTLVPCLAVVCAWLQGMGVVESFICFHISFIAKNTKIFLLLHSYAYLAFCIRTALALGFLTIIRVRFSYRNDFTYI